MADLASTIFSERGKDTRSYLDRQAKFLSKQSENITAKNKVYAEILEKKQSANSLYGGSLMRSAQQMQQGPQNLGTGIMSSVLNALGVELKAKSEEEKYKQIEEALGSKEGSDILSALEQMQQMSASVNAQNQYLNDRQEALNKQDNFNFSKEQIADAQANGFFKDLISSAANSMGVNPSDIVTLNDGRVMVKQGDGQWSDPIDMIEASPEESNTTATGHFNVAKANYNNYLSSQNQRLSEAEKERDALREVLIKQGFNPALAGYMSNSEMQNSLLKEAKINHYRAYSLAQDPKTQVEIAKKRSEVEKGVPSHADRLNIFKEQQEIKKNFINPAKTILHNLDKLESVTKELEKITAEASSFDLSSSAAQILNEAWNSNSQKGFSDALMRANSIKFLDQKERNYVSRLTSVMAPIKTSLLSLAASDVGASALRSAQIDLLHMNAGPNESQTPQAMQESIVRTLNMLKDKREVISGMLEDSQRDLDYLGGSLDRMNKYGMPNLGGGSNNGSGSMSGGQTKMVIVSDPTGQQTRAMPAEKAIEFIRNGGKLL